MQKIQGGRSALDLVVRDLVGECKQDLEVE